MKAAAGYFSKTEKIGCHEIAVRNSNIIDVEITFPGKVSLDDGSDDKQGPRVDIASVEPYGDDQARLVFWEAKAFGNGELVAAGEDVPVCRQIEGYRKYLSQNSVTIEKDYKLVAKNLVEIHKMGWVRSLSPLIEDIGLGRRGLTLGAEPKVGLTYLALMPERTTIPAGRSISSASERISATCGRRATRRTSGSERDSNPYRSPRHTADRWELHRDRAPGRRPPHPRRRAAA